MELKEARSGPPQSVLGEGSSLHKTLSAQLYLCELPDLKNSEGMHSVVFHRHARSSLLWQAYKVTKHGKSHNTQKREQSTDGEALLWGSGFWFPSHFNVRDIFLNPRKFFLDADIL